MSPSERSSSGACSTSDGAACASDGCTCPTTADSSGRSSSSGSIADQGPGVALVHIPGTQKFVKAVHYAEASYWDERYHREVDDFEWFLGFRALRRLLKATISKTKPCLQIGCGTSNVQEGMAKAGHTVVNLEISPVVVEQMQARHRGQERLSYVLGDCRDMREFMDCQFGSVLEKGTLDALLCSKDAETNTHRMMSEISRVLLPGGTFLLISLGPPSKRLHMINRPDYSWTVSLVLLPKLSNGQQAHQDGKPINDALHAIKYLGPWAVTESNAIPELPSGFDPSQFFYGYICRKQLLQLSGSSSARSQLPDSWAITAREVAARMHQEMGLAPDILTKGVRRRVLRVPKGSPIYALATSHSSRVRNPAPGFNTPSALQRYVSAPDLTVKEVAEGTLSMLAVRAGSETSSDECDGIKALRPALSVDGADAALQEAEAPHAPQAPAHDPSQALPDTAASDSVGTRLLTLPMALQMQVADGVAVQAAADGAMTAAQEHSQAPGAPAAAAAASVHMYQLCLAGKQHLEHCCDTESCTTDLASSLRSSNFNLLGSEHMDGGSICEAAASGRITPAAMNHTHTAARSRAVSPAPEDCAPNAAYGSSCTSTADEFTFACATVRKRSIAGAQLHIAAPADPTATATTTAASHQAAANALAAEVAAASPAAALGMALLLQGRTANGHARAALDSPGAKKQGASAD